MNLVELVEKNYMNKAVADFPKFRTGDTIAVHAKIKEGNKERIQVYEGICIAMKHPGKMSGHFRVRKVSAGMGVERVFPFHSPNIAKIEVVSFGKSKRAKHFYLRERTGKAAKIAIDFNRKDD